MTHHSQEDSRNNSKEMTELLGYMARHHDVSVKVARCVTDYESVLMKFKKTVG
jgi:hypothetical protein